MIFLHFLFFLINLAAFLAGIIIYGQNYLVFDSFLYSFYDFLLISSNSCDFSKISKNFSVSFEGSIYGKLIFFMQIFETRINLVSKFLSSFSRYIGIVESMIHGLHGPPPSGRSLFTCRVAGDQIELN